jgi:nucleotide-binding universal stress UspA family protein
MTTTLPLLVAYDGSVDARRALTWTAHESVRTGVPVHVLAVNEILQPTWGGVGGMVVVTEGYVLDSSALLEQAEKILADEGVTTVTTEQRTGPVVPELLRAAASASTLVVGSRGHGAAGEAHHFVDLLALGGIAVVFALVMTGRRKGDKDHD